MTGLASTAHRTARPVTRQRCLRAITRRPPCAAAFTLLEILLASVAAAMVLVVVYSIFTTVLRLRDNATARLRQSRLRARAVTMLRRDLQGALLSGGILANVLEGDSNKESTLPNSAAPGYLRLTTTTGKDNATDLFGDVQEVEYYIKKDSGDVSGNPAQGGTLVRAVTRDLLTSVTLAIPRVESLLTNVQSLRVSFYDGTNWQQSWQAVPTQYGNQSGPSPSPTPSTDDLSGTNAGINTISLPQAIRVDIQQTAPTAREHTPPLLELLVPWTTQPFTSPTPAPSS